ncbi:MAG: hypothetical protein ABL985_02770 [Casimicrobium sp.]
MQTHSTESSTGQALLSKLLRVLVSACFVSAALHGAAADALAPTPTLPYLILSANPANLDMTLAAQPTIVRVSPRAEACRFGVFVIAPSATASTLNATASAAVTSKQAVSFDYSINSDNFCIVSAINTSTATVTAGTIKPVGVGSLSNPDLGIYDGYHNAFSTAHKSAFRDFGQGKFDELVGPITGRLWMTHTDVVIPGANGLDIRVLRNYVSPDAEQIANGLFAGYSLEPQLNGFGWHVIANFGGIRGMVGACGMRHLAGDSEDYDGVYLRAETLPQWINADGSPEPLVPVAVEGQDYIRPFTAIVWRTASGITVDCGSDEYHPVATLPDGTKIEMNATTADQAILGAWNAFPTRITDRWGNWLNFEWDTSYGVLFYWASNYRQGHMANALPITRITASDGREVRFVYASLAPSWLANPVSPIPVTEKILKAIEYGAHKIEYTYDRELPQPNNYLASSSAKYFLRRVDTPDGFNWRYDYWPLPADIYAPAAGDATLKTIFYPHGGTASYDWGGSRMTTQPTPLSPTSVSKSFQVRKKTTSDFGVWRYSYTDMVRAAADEANDPIPTMTGLNSGPGADLPYTFNNVFVSLEAGRITGPSGIEVFYHMPRYSLGENQPFETWRLGRLLQHTTYDLGTIFSATQAATSRQSQSYSYLPIYFPIGGLLGSQQSVLPILHASCSMPGCPAAETPAMEKPAYLVRLASTTITRGTNQYTTSHDAYMAFCGKPTTVTETGQRNRSIVVEFDRTGYCQATSRQLNENGVRRSRVASLLRTDKLAVATETHFGPTDTAGLSTSYTYFSTGELNTKTDANSYITVFQDYRRGTPKTEWHPVSVFDAANDAQRITITRVVDDLGDITSETDGEGRTTQFTYNGVHKPKTITLPRAASSTIGFVYGSTSDTITRGARMETVGYDGFGRVTTYNDGLNTTKYGYDAAGQRNFVSFPGSMLGQAVTYDALGRPTKLTEPDPSVNSTTSTVDTNIAYDDNANTITITNPRTHPTTLTMEAFGDPSSGWVKSRNSPEIGLTSYVRNVFGQIEQITQSGVDRNFVYDANKGYFLTQETHPELGTIYYDRDNNGNATGKRVGSNSAPTTGQTFDGQNRLITVTPAAINGMQVGPGISNVWYRTGLLKSTAAGPVSRAYTYDDNNNLSTEAITIDGTTRTLSYAYDALDSLNRLTYPSGKFVDFNPDLLGRPQQVGSTSLNIVTNATYWPSGLPKQIAYANGVSQDFTEQQRPLLSALSITKTASATNHMSLGFGYDKVGNQTSITESPALGYARDATYDAFDRILSNTGESFTYEGSGDIKTKSGATFTYDTTQRRLLSITGTVTRAFTYDTYGNAVTDGRGFGYSFDALNSLRQVKLNSTVTASYDYDGHQHLAKKVASDGTTHYLYGMNGRLFGEYLPTTNKSKEYFYLGNKLVGQIAK